MSPARHSAICAEIQQLHQTKESKLLARIAELEAQLAQRTWDGLTQEELSEIYNRTEWNTVTGWDYERAIEAKLKEKNT